MMIGKYYPAGKQLLFIGDQTGIGHFCALQQLAAAATEIHGFINFNDPEQPAPFRQLYLASVTNNC